ncbi:hypothetical protein J1N35_021652 [Gossypium stocksii]|uniref:Uncharacterized protein n=1 Tax=Gossypium stocksii TaxID=47602 RepID=A0A9D4A0D9_9ROSI|nr:hypothetical protein J1N35_021652 [Gossypium stocksii]
MGIVWPSRTGLIQDKLSDRNDVFEAMVMALKEKTIAMTMALSTRIEEFEVELVLCRATVGEGVSSTTLSNKNVPKPKRLIRTSEAKPKIKGKVRLGRGKSSNEVERRGVQKLSEAMTIAESVVKLGLRKDKLGSFKSKERGVREKDYKEDNNGNDISDNGGNGKP